MHKLVSLIQSKNMFLHFYHLLLHINPSPIIGTSKNIDMYRYSITLI